MVDILDTGRSRAIGWDATIRPVMPVIPTSPENKRKRRFDDRRHSAATGAPGGVSGGGSPKRHRASTVQSVVPMRRRIESLDRGQLMDIFDELANSHPEIAYTIQRLVPEIRPESALAVLREYAAAVREHLPHGDTATDYAYLRVQPYLQEFFVALADYTAAFTSPSEQTVSRTVEFLDGATELLHGLPRWSTPMNNALVNRAYEELAALWAVAIAGVAARPFPISLAPYDTQMERHNRLSGGRMTEAVGAMASLRTDAFSLAYPETLTDGTRAF